MSYFYVDVNGIENVGVELANISANLLSAKNNVENIRGKLSGSMLKVAGVLNSLTTELQKEIEYCKKQQETLVEVVTYYRNTENTLLVVQNVDSLVDAVLETLYGDETEKTDDMSYEEYLEYRCENAVDENTKRLYEKYRKKIKIREDDYSGTAHYNGLWNHINYNIEDDTTNSRGMGSTYYHEVGHLIDDQSDWNSYTSTDWSYDFYDKLQEDVDNWAERIMQEKGYTDIQDAYDDMTEWLWTDPDNKNGISDLINGLTEGEACGRWLHDSGYYNSKSIPKEAFAHFFEAGMSADSTKLDYIKEIFPNAYEEFQQMVEDELD